MPSYQSRIIEQAKFTYSPLGKAFEKQIKTTEDQGLKQVEALKALKPEEIQELKSTEGTFSTTKLRNNEIKNVTDKIKKQEEKIKRKHLKYETKKNIYGFQQYEKVRSLSDNIYTGKVTIDEAEMDQINLLENIVEFKTRLDKKTIEGKDEKEILMKVHMLFMKVEN